MGTSGGTGESQLPNRDNLPVLAQGHELITDGASEIVAKKLEKWKKKHREKNFVIVKKEEQEKVLAARKKFERKRKYFIDYFVALSKDFFHAPRGELRQLGKDPFKLFELQIVRQARGWALASYSGLILFPAVVFGSIKLVILGASLSVSIGGFLFFLFGVLGTLFSVLAGGSYYITFFKWKGRDWKDDHKSYKYLACRRLMKKVCGEDGMIEILRKGLTNKG